MTADDKSKVYGVADPTPTATVEGTIGSDKVAYALERAAGEDAGVYTITVSGDAFRDNYIATFVNGTIVVMAKKYSTYSFAYNNVPGGQPASDKQQAIARTGDASNLALAGLALAAAAAAGIAFATSHRRRKR